MKFLYHSPQPDDMTILLKENGKEEYENYSYTIKELFKLKDKYESIKIRMYGLYYKTSKQSKKRYSIKGFIDIKEYEYGGEWETIPIKEQVEILLKEREEK